MVDLARKMWHKFEAKPQKEKAPRVSDISHPAIELKTVRYGGNLAYITVLSSMHLGVSQNAVRRYAPAAIAIENALNCVQPRFLSCWLLALFQKRN